MNNKKSLTRETAAGRNNQVREGAARILFLAAACVSILAVLLITVFLLVSGVPAIAEIGVFKFLLGTVWKPGNDIYGILPMILGSLYVTSGALILGVPIGVLTAIFLSRFASKKMVSFVKPAVQLLAGIPSVVYGFFGLVVIVPLLGGRGSMLAASIVLAIMILPTVITVSESSLNAVESSYYEGALALGATHERSVFSIILRHWSRNRRSDGGHYGCRQPAAHAAGHSEGASHAHDQHRHGDGLFGRPASRSADCNRCRSLRLYPHHQLSLFTYETG